MNVRWAVITIAAAFIEITWLEAVRFAGVLPNLTLVLVVYFAIADGEERAMFTGLVGGLIQDAAQHGALGHHVLCYVVVGYSAGRLSRRLVTEHPAVKIGLVFCAAVLYGLLYTAIDYVQDPAIRALRTVTAVVIPTAFYTALVTVIVFHLLNRLFPQETALHGEPS